jgi:hypothetical protein
VRSDRSSNVQDTVVDFTSASLYLSGLQTVFATVCTSAVSVLICFFFPGSAVRTLAICSATGAFLIHRPLRVGKAHGTNVVFSALQPAVLVYLSALVIEQLVHTCSIDVQEVPSYTRWLFVACTIGMLLSGFVRASNPLQENDVTFLSTSFFLMVVALVPPPSIALSGPLCSTVGGWTAADRVYRSFVFSTLYSIHVYASIKPNGLTRADGMLVITRSAAASAWTLCAHWMLSPVAFIQCGFAIWNRLKYDEKTPIIGNSNDIDKKDGYDPIGKQNVSSAMSDAEPDTEKGLTGTDDLYGHYQHKDGRLDSLQQQGMMTLESKHANNDTAMQKRFYAAAIPNCGSGGDGNGLSSASYQETATSTASVCTSHSSNSSSHSSSSSNNGDISNNLLLQHYHNHHNHHNHHNPNPTCGPDSTDDIGSTSSKNVFSGRLKFVNIASQGMKSTEMSSDKMMQILENMP